MDMPSIERLAAAAAKLTKHTGKPKRKRGKRKAARKSPKRVKVAKKGPRKTAKRLPRLGDLQQRYKRLLSRKASSKEIKKVEAQLQGGKFRYDWE